MPWWGVLAIALVAVLILIFMNVVTLSGATAGAILVAQNATDSRVPGVITESRTTRVPSRKGADSFYCHGRFDSDAGDVRQRKVRVYVDGDCVGARQAPATLVAGVGWAQPRTGRPPLLLEGLLGMSDGASVGHPTAFWRSLWPFLLLVPFTVLIDFCAFYGIQGQVVAVRSRRRSTPVPG